MDGAAFGYLLSGPGGELLAEAMSMYDGSNALAVATTLRRTSAPDHVAAALSQVELRHRARAKFGDDAYHLYFTPDGLEQATHPVVARHRARRLANGLRTDLRDGRGRVLDLCCGIGSDLIAFAEAGLASTGVDRDPVTAAVARANLAVVGVQADVLVGDAEAADRSAHHVTFVDPARRSAAGRTFSPAAYSPPWSFVEDVLRGPAVAKVAPGIPHELVPDRVEAEWVSLNGRLKEASLWSVGTDRTRVRATVLHTDGAAASITDRDPATEPHVAPPGRFVYEPDDAVIRAHLVTTVCAQVDGWLLDDHLAYVGADQPVRTPWARGFEVLEVLPFKEKQLRAALRARDVGPLTIKKRGIAVSPEALRSRLGLTGSTAATVILTRTPRSSAALLVRPLTWMQPSPRPRTS